MVADAGWMCRLEGRVLSDLVLPLFLRLSCPPHVSVSSSQTCWGRWVGGLREQSFPSKEACSVRVENNSIIWAWMSAFLLTSFSHSAWWQDGMTGHHCDFTDWQIVSLLISSISFYLWCAPSLLNHYSWMTLFIVFPSLDFIFMFVFREQNVDNNPHIPILFLYFTHNTRLKIFFFKMRDCFLSSYTDSDHLILSIIFHLFGWIFHQYNVTKQSVI